MSEDAGSETPKPLELVTRAEGSHREVIEALATAGAFATRHKATGILILVETVDGYATYKVSPDVITTVGRIEVLKFELQLEHLVEQANT